MDCCIIHQREGREEENGFSPFFLYSLGEDIMELTLDILTFLKSKFYTKDEIDDKLGSIETLLDEILGV